MALTQRRNGDGLMVWYLDVFSISALPAATIPSLGMPACEYKHFSSGGVPYWPNDWQTDVNFRMPLLPCGRLSMRAPVCPVSLLSAHRLLQAEEAVWRLWSALSPKSSSGGLVTALYCLYAVPCLNCTTRAPNQPLCRDKVRAQDRRLRPNWCVSPLPYLTTAFWDAVLCCDSSPLANHLCCSDCGVRRFIDPVCACSQV